MSPAHLAEANANPDVPRKEAAAQMKPHQT